MRAMTPMEYRISGARLVGVVALGDREHEPVALERGLDGPQRARAPGRDRGRETREDDRPPQGQNWQCLALRHANHLLQKKGGAVTVDLPETYLWYARSVPRHASHGVSERTHTLSTANTTRGCRHRRGGRRTSYDRLAGFATSDRYSDVVLLPNRRVLSIYGRQCYYPYSALKRARRVSEPVVPAADSEMRALVERALSATLRTGRRDRPRGHGHRLPRARPPPQADGRRSRCSRRNSPSAARSDALPARGRDGGAAQPPQHRPHLHGGRSAGAGVLRDGVHQRRQPRQAAARPRGAAGRRRCAASSAKWPTRWPTPTSAASCTATSSPTTSCSTRRPAARWSPTSASRGR